MVLVTGGTGLLGAHLLLELAQHEAAIRAIYRNPQKMAFTKKLFSLYGKEAFFEKIQWLKADILDIISLEEIYEDVQYVYHCAAIVSFNPAEQQQMMKINIDGTANMVNIALENKIKKFCYVSSVAAIGEYAGNKCSDEQAIWQKSKSTTNYSISKYYAENEVWRASEEGLKIVIVNPSTILGVGNWEEGSSAIFKKVYDGLKFYPAGSNSFVGVKDVVKAMIQLMKSDVQAKRYILSSENLSFKQLLTLMAKSFDRKAPTMKASKKLAKFLASTDMIVSFLSAKKPLLTHESVEVSYKHSCYSNEKAKEDLKIKFQKMEELIPESAKLYKELFSLV